MCKRLIRKPSNSNTLQKRSCEITPSGQDVPLGGRAALLALRDNPVAADRKDEPIDIVVKLSDFPDDPLTETFQNFG